MNQQKDWKNLERHPLSAEYEDIAGPRWVEFVADMREQKFDLARPIVLFEGKILDGWQRQRACVMTFITPVYIEYDGDDPEGYVRRHNDNRRHETPLQREQRMERAAERRERVVAARVDGKSIRAIAESENVSIATVQRDIEEATVSGDTVEPANGQVIGKDKKKRAAKGKKKPKAEELNEPAPKTKAKGPSVSITEPFDVQFEKLYDALLLLLDRRKQKMGADKCFTACLNAAFECRKHYKAWVSA